MSDPFHGYGAMPGNVRELHPKIKRMLMRKVWEKAITIFGWPMLLKWLYAGNPHLGMLESQTYQCDPSAFYPHLCAEAKALEEKGQ